MLNYCKAIDPSLKSNVFTYTDTDSLHITGENHKKLFEMGYIVTKNNSKLGYLCSDIKNEGIIISENNLAPKSYHYEYIDEDNKVCLRDQGTYKCKGIPNKNLQIDLYKSYDVNNKEYNDKIKEIENNNNLSLKEKKIEKEQIKNKNEITFFGLKKKHKTLTKTDKENNMRHFSIVNNNQTRTFMSSTWDGFKFDGINNYFPHGYSVDN
jgi:hypothetical protein